MKCPLLTAAIVKEYGNNPNFGFDCLKEECAWWNDMYDACSVQSLAWSLDKIENTIRTVAENRGEVKPE